MRVSGLVLGAFFVASHAAAQQQAPCGPRAFVIDRLGSVYGESRQAVGLDGSGNVIEVWANEGTGSWSITVTRPVDRLTCISGAGQAFELLSEAAGRDG